MTQKLEATVTNSYTPLILNAPFPIKTLALAIAMDTLVLITMLYGINEDHNLKMSAFSMCFATMSILTGITVTYNTGLAYGGPISMTYGWLMVGLFTTFIGLSMGEIYSSYPTAGGIYFWSYKLAGEKWGPFASWIAGWYNVIGRLAGTASVEYALATFLREIILLATGGNNGGGYFASKYVVLAFEAVLLSIHVCFNSLPVSWLSYLVKFGASWNISGLSMLLIVLPLISPKSASSDFVFTHMNTETVKGIESTPYIFLIGILMAQYSLSGFDTALYMSDEIKKPEINGPFAIVSSIGVSILVGWAYILSITFTATDISWALNVNNDSKGFAVAQIFYDAFKNRYGSGAGGVICLCVVVIAVFCCGASSMASTSRSIFAFSRDGAMPFSDVWRKVNHFDVPFNAVVLTASCSFAMAVTSIGSMVAFQAMVSIAMVGLYISYGLPSLLRITIARKSFQPGPFALGRFGVIVGWVSVLWIGCLAVLFCLPITYPINNQTLNYAPVAVVGLLIFSLIGWIYGARHWFKGPITKTNEDCVECGSF